MWKRRERGKCDIGLKKRGERRRGTRGRRGICWMGEIMREEKRERRVPLNTGEE